jgi:hypothetical protein
MRSGGEFAIPGLAAWFYIVLCIGCCLWMLLSEIRHPQGLKGKNTGA